MTIRYATQIKSPVYTLLSMHVCVCWSLIHYHWICIKKMCGTFFSYKYTYSVLCCNNHLTMCGLAIHVQQTCVNMYNMCGVELVWNNNDVKSVSITLTPRKYFNTSSYMIYLFLLQESDSGPLCYSRLRVSNIYAWQWMKIIPTLGIYTYLQK